jgi:hypothetical protein
MKRALEKECRALALSCLRPSDLSRLPQRREVRDRHHRKVQREDPKEEHHPQGQNSLREIIPSGSG